MSIINTISNLSLSASSLNSKVNIGSINGTALNNYTQNETSNNFTEFFKKSYDKTKDGWTLQNGIIKVGSNPFGNVASPTWLIISSEKDILPILFDDTNGVTFDEAFEEDGEYEPFDVFRFLSN
ncbi:hypothetical protein ACTFIV_004482 [Dictyostelium citrinum]